MKENKEDQKPHGFCVTPDSKCTMNYCDDNGCNDRKRDLAPGYEAAELYASQFKVKEDSLSPKPDTDIALEVLLDMIDTLYLIDLNKGLIGLHDLEKATRTSITNYTAHYTAHLQSRIAELESDNKTWEALENDRAEEIGKLMARVVELEKKIADWFLTVSERDEQIEKLREDIALLEKELSNTETALEVTFQKWREYCNRNGLEEF